MNTNENHSVTCRTENCENDGISLIIRRPGHTIICGSCGFIVTDISPPLPEEPYNKLEPEEMSV